MYKLNISGHHVQSGEEVQTAVKEKLDHLARINSHITTINVILNTEKHKAHELIVEASVHIPNHDLFATVKTDKQLAPALDMLVAKLEKQLLKYKAKHEGRKHHPDSRDLESDREREEQDEFNELAERSVL
ncbi:ribosome hibernation-promoting factor, HPF/YfiA family [Marinomonas mediterranea]|jgi:SSU ribosomal protein S30P/sigma 54 modulation protein|uniref:Ribosomal subunit interface protein n=1 Tax=Marinomonas mediterranea (strain ATCC 700492 / JCM 21426 / NBRC 103028 / MMB-1) TaxID=717774 RepID=F2JTJ9_MARM1|nr:ribosome-associated translation inhibitor RaiA [Marinomonas mediterranea]ADZ91513.1 ribosomal subunit interface protein [Marinomonas mediterranea MMB-1]WCN09479.1 ribosome-associated translation inhibitor RaiA [Marinomonas mediterranea]WCN13555.1 ribosome-associated translation inhibitor RaiA [Marinomonas mediterranea]WCN17621.1 ribosome-associated translation inhibitor RaiA [Marinomonas mediterranea MMB-1]